MSVPHADPHVRTVTVRIVQTQKLGLGDRGLGQGRSPGLGPGVPDAEAQVARSVPGKRAGTRRDGHRILSASDLCKVTAGYGSCVLAVVEPGAPLFALKNRTNIRPCPDRPFSHPAGSGRAATAEGSCGWRSRDGRSVTTALLFWASRTFRSRRLPCTLTDTHGRTTAAGRWLRSSVQSLRETDKARRRLSPVCPQRTASRWPSSQSPPGRPESCLPRPCVEGPCHRLPSPLGY